MGLFRVGPKTVDSFAAAVTSVHNAYFECHPGSPKRRPVLLWYGTGREQLAVMGGILIARAGTDREGRPYLRQPTPGLIAVRSVCPNPPCHAATYYIDTAPHNCTLQTRQPGGNTRSMWLSSHGGALPEGVLSISLGTAEFNGRTLTGNDPAMLAAAGFIISHCEQDASGQPVGAVPGIPLTVGSAV